MIRRLATIPERVFLVLQHGAVVAGVWLYSISSTGHWESTSIWGVLVGVTLMAAPLWLGGAYA